MANNYVRVLIMLNLNIVWLYDDRICRVRNVDNTVYYECVTYIAEDDVRGAMRDYVNMLSSRDICDSTLLFNIAFSKANKYNKSRVVLPFNLNSSVKEVIYYIACDIFPYIKLSVLCGSRKVNTSINAIRIVDINNHSYLVPNNLPPVILMDPNKCCLTTHVGDFTSKVKLCL